MDNFKQFTPYGPLNEGYQKKLEQLSIARYREGYGWAFITQIVKSFERVKDREGKSNRGSNLRDVQIPYMAQLLEFAVEKDLSGKRKIEIVMSILDKPEILQKYNNEYSEFQGYSTPIM